MSNELDLETHSTNSYIINIDSINNDSIVNNDSTELYKSSSKSSDLVTINLQTVSTDQINIELPVEEEIEVRNSTHLRIICINCCIGLIAFMAIPILFILLFAFNKVIIN